MQEGSSTPFSKQWMLRNRATPCSPSLHLHEKHCGEQISNDRRRRSKARLTIKVANSGQDVFLLTSSGVHIDALALVGGASGVEIQHTSNCVVTNCTMNGNVFGVYLIGATANEVSNNNLNSNGFGIYLDESSGNKLSGNSAVHETGGGGRRPIAMGFTFTTVILTTSHRILSANHVYGISLFHSSNNGISNNTVSASEQIGVRW